MASKNLFGLDVSSFLKLNGTDVATQIYVDAAVASAGGDNFNQSSEVSLAAWITATSYDGTQLGESDILFLPNAEKGARRYWNNGNGAGDASDFVNIDEVLTAAEVQSALTSGQGLAFSGGEFSIQNGGVTPAMLSSDVTDAMGDAVGFAETMTGDDTTTSFVVNHNANSQDLVYSIRDLTTNKAADADVEFTSVNSVTVSFGAAPATGQNYRITIKRVS